MRERCSWQREQLEQGKDGGLTEKESGKAEWDRTREDLNAQLRTVVSTQAVSSSLGKRKYLKGRN